MFGKTLAALVAAFIILFSYVLPLALPFAAVQVLPGVEFNYSPGSFLGWCALLIATAFLLWSVEMCGKFACAQATVFPNVRPHASQAGFWVELILGSLVFRLLISSLLISVLCSLLLMLLSYFLEGKFNVHSQIASKKG